jgi:hypothetical protein
MEPSMADSRVFIHAATYAVGLIHRDAGRRLGFATNPVGHERDTRRF